MLVMCLCVIDMCDKHYIGALQTYDAILRCDKDESTVHNSPRFSFEDSPSCECWPEFARIEILEPRFSQGSAILRSFGSSE